MTAKGQATIKLPNAYEGLVFNVHNNTGYGPIAFKQEAPVLIDGKWTINILLQKPEGPKGPRLAG
jgi:hypothetical protein